MTSRLERLLAWLSPAPAARRAAARERLVELAREPAPGRRGADSWRYGPDGDAAPSTPAEELGEVLRRMARERWGRR